MRTIQNEPEPMMFIRAYLRASTNEQDANRARQMLEDFAKERGLKVAAWYAENESGASLKRPKLFQLLADSHPSDVLLVEQVDRLSRLNGEDWQHLKAEIQSKRVRVVALDLPTSWQLAAPGDELTQRMLEALNGMMLDMLAAIARKDYEDRRRRVTYGIEKAKAEGKYKGKQVDEKLHQRIRDLLAAGWSWSKVCDTTKASRSTVARVVAARRVADPGGRV